MKVEIFKKNFLSCDSIKKVLIVHNMKNDIENSEKTRTNEEHQSFLKLIDWCEENLKKDSK